MLVLILNLGWGCVQVLYMTLADVEMLQEILEHAMSSKCVSK